MLNSTESPKNAKECFLSDILEPRKDVQEKYYLSMKACQGILRRSSLRGKPLPQELKEALERQIALTSECVQVNPGGAREHYSQ